MNNYYNQTRGLCILGIFFLKLQMPLCVQDSQCAGFSSKACYPGTMLTGIKNKPTWPNVYPASLKSFKQPHHSLQYLKCAPPAWRGRGLTGPHYHSWCRNSTPKVPEPQGWLLRCAAGRCSECIPGKEIKTTCSQICNERVALCISIVPPTWLLVARPQVTLPLLL